MLGGGIASIRQQQGFFQLLKQLIVNFLPSENLRKRATGFLQPCFELFYPSNTGCSGRSYGVWACLFYYRNRSCQGRFCGLNIRFDCYFCRAACLCWKGCSSGFCGRTISAYAQLAFDKGKK